MGQCRSEFIASSMGVRPFGMAYQADQLVTTAIDQLAFPITWQQHVFAIDGPVPPASAPPLRPAPNPGDADEPE